MFETLRLHPVLPNPPLCSPMQASARLSSSAASRRVIAGVSSTITRSCYRTFWGKAHAAPLSAQETPKGQKRITKEERRVRIEEFVEKYMASNDGKFPTIKTVRRHVGGAHYTVREILQEVEYNHAKLPLDKSKAAQLHEAAEFHEHSRPEDGNGNNSFNSQSFNRKQDLDDVILSQRDDAASTEIMEKTETRGSLELKTTSDSSRCNGETEAAKQDLYTADILKIANGSTVSSQTESDAMKTEASISLGLETKSDLGNHQGETEANKLDLNNTENLLNASEPAVSDHPEIEKVFKANVLDREENPELEHEESRRTSPHEESTRTSLLGSLKYFVYGIRNFWKKL